MEDTLSGTFGSSSASGTPVASSSPIPKIEDNPRTTSSMDTESTQHNKD